MMKHIKTIPLFTHDQLVISQAVVDDAAQVVDFLNLVGGETDYLTFGLNEFHLSTAEEATFISNCLSLGQCLMLVGKIDGELVSQLYLDRSSCARLSHIGDLGLSVKKKYWGQSIATYMMRTAMMWAQEHGITKLQLHVRTDNEAAIHLYTKLGFCKEGLITRAIKINQVFYDNYIMGLMLDDLI